ncbi:MAG: M24 family metallopeptidase [Planctomycetota bacterium]|jgi:Xaa-Pro aminopeptidase
MIHRISADEFIRRQNRVREALETQGLAGAYLTSPVSVFYLTGFHMVSTERPAALLMPLVGDPGFVGPRLEEAHVARDGGGIAVIRTYFDDPGETHPMEAIANFLCEMGMGKGRIGTDNPAGYTGRWGYQGPKLFDLLPRVEFVEFGDFLTSLRKVKSEEEIALLRESCRWADRALECLVAETAEGVWDAEAGLAATLVATREMKKALGETFRQAVHGNAPAAAGYRGQVGTATAIPHAFATEKRIEGGDVLGAGATAEVGGYHCELERTIILGKPKAEQERYFEIMVRAQDAAISALRPGVPCGEADRAAYKVLQEEGVADRTLHHSGHSLGLEFHEPPFLDTGEREPLKPGMVFAVEPGIYFPDFAGFRHSDTVVVTEEGPERLTAFPRDLKACTIPVKRRPRKGAVGKSRGKGGGKPARSGDRARSPRRSKPQGKKAAGKKTGGKKSGPQKRGGKGKGKGRGKG